MRAGQLGNLLARGKKYAPAALVLLAGVILLLLPSGKEAPAEIRSGEGAAEPFELEAFEEKLERSLSAIEGAGETRVVLTLDGGSRQVLAQDREQDGDGASSSTVTLGRGSGEQSVVPLQTMAPSFRGALVVCPGGNDPQVRLRLTQAVAALTGLGADRITVCPGNA